MSQLAFRQPNITMTDRAVSLSGKYLLFYGFHYEAGVTCWVIGSSNKATGEIVMRHYNEKIPGCIAPHAVSRTTWDEFRNVMTEKREDAEYEEGYLESLEKYLN